MRPIGYYVHHHGAGHWQRACLIGRALRRPVTLIGSFAGVDTGGAPGPVLDLPDDRLAAAFDGCDEENARPSSLHYAPLGHAGIRARMARIAAWANEADPVLMIVDVSVEVAMLARLLSVPTIVVRLSGMRTDAPHLDAFRGATRLLAPFPERLDGDMPGWIREKTLYAGFLGEAAATPTESAEDGSIVVLLGRGGTALDGPALSRAARAVPERQWHVLGEPSGADDGAARPPNLHRHGWVTDVGAHLARAALVVGGAGDGVVGAVVAHGKRFVCLPEDRPYGEQAAKASALARLGAAVVVTEPESADWAGLVARGLALDPAAILGLRDPNAVAAIAARIEAIAAGIEAR